MNVLETAIYDLIIAATAVTDLLDGTASVYNQLVPRGQAYPVVVFGYLGGGDENKTPHRSVNFLYQVRGVSKTSPANAGLIDAALDTVFHLQTLTVSGWTNTWTAREDEIKLTEVTPEGDEIYHRGGIYRVRLAK